VNQGQQEKQDLKAPKVYRDPQDPRDQRETVLQMRRLNAYWLLLRLISILILFILQYQRARLRVLKD
jgi:hypothetical protein